MDIEILKIASDTRNHKVIDNYTHISKQKNHLCGDEMQVSLNISNNKIIDFAYQCKSCIYCQASASMLSRTSMNKSTKIVKDFITSIDTFFESSKIKFPKEWKKLEVLFVKKNIARKDCILLPFKTLAKALKN
ncbi:iron-sulfur cluster assembly scaffold protein [bacterium]|nr:iron-sulfur cluster assembly scaffold protein [bacterium]|tara:strand:- start:826 stop:1224 length:399 start_codon:yes stop_codon:yes gene_type:complete